MLQSRSLSSLRPCAAPSSRRLAVRPLAAMAQPSQQWKLPRAQDVLQATCTLAAAGLLLAGSGHAAVAETSRAGDNLGFLTDTEVQERRSVLGFTRAFDGKVALRSAKNTKALWDVKLDLKSPGTLLLRSPEGAVFYLAYESLQQIDLSDDEVVGAISSSPWEANAKAVEAIDDDEKLQKLELTREGFYELISVVDP